MNNWSTRPKRRQPQPVEPVQTDDLGNQIVRAISLSIHNDSTVGSSLSGMEIFRVATPTATQSVVIIAELAKVLRTNSSQLTLYENGRCLGDNDVITDLSSIIVKQAMRQKTASSDGPQSPTLAVTVKQMAPKAQAQVMKDGKILLGSVSGADKTPLPMALGSAITASEETDLPVTLNRLALVAPPQTDKKELRLRNDDGVAIEFGDNKFAYIVGMDGSVSFYCGREVGYDVLGEDSDGICGKKGGPHGGPQCPPCKRFQASQQKAMADEENPNLAESNEVTENTRPPDALSTQQAFDRSLRL